MITLAVTPLLFDTFLQIYKVFLCHQFIMHFAVLCCHGNGDDLSSGSNVAKPGVRPDGIFSRTAE